MYPTGSSSNIGTLLRMIQEDQNKTPVAQTPAADVNSPIRGVTQEPITSPESPDSSRVISVRPEGVTAAGAAPGAVVIPSGGGVNPVAPIGPAPLAGKVINPIVFTPPPPGPGQAPAVHTDGRNSAPQAAPSPISLGTRITAAPPPAPRFTPTTSRIGPLIVKKPTPNRAFA